MSNESQTFERLARIETHIESMAKTLDTIAKDHETRIRVVEGTQQNHAGALKLIAFIGAPSLTAIVVFLGTHGTKAIGG